MSKSTNMGVLPFLKWAGGKRWLYASYPELFPTSYIRYIEPFMGGGSIFFALMPENALLADLNQRLVECYEQMRDNSDQFWKIMLQHQRQHSDEYYYKVRAKKLRTPTTRAAQFLYLNRTCWNGLYRVNLKGEFNVPRGTKNAVVFSDEDFSSYATAFEGTVLSCCDFEETLAKAGKGDFVFIDPPYTVKHNCNGFKKYNEKIFSWHDQVRLRDAVTRAGDRGALVLVCNANHEDIRQLYESIGKKHTVHRRSIIAGKSIFRSNTTEIAITINYAPTKTITLAKEEQFQIRP